MKYTKEQQDFIKHCGEHFEILTGGRGHSKTKEIIEDMQKEIERLNNIIEELGRWIQRQADENDDSTIISKSYKFALYNIIDKLQELKEWTNEDN